jgi:hypothetical protein
MGFVLSILYFVTYYLAPATIFGPLAAFHVELILAALVTLVSLPTLLRSFMVKTPQALALIGLAFAVFLSVLIAMHWPRVAMQALLDFIPNAFAYYLICLHCNSKMKLRVIVLMLLFVCLFVIAHGYIDLRHGLPDHAVINLEDAETPYLLPMASGTGEWFYRLRGLGEINDPNDFAQLIVCVVPLMFIFWRSKRTFRNCVLVLLPVCVLLYGAFLTHSRGALLALLAMTVVAARRRIGTVPAMLSAVGLFVAAMALNFTGGRDISSSAGSDRTALWGESLQLLKSHPLFGVGYANLVDYLGHTSHNSVAVCAAELGIFGLYFWSMFLLPTVRDGLAIASPVKVSEAEPFPQEEELYPQAARAVEVVDKAEINSMGRLLVLSLTGFFVTGWFLSRSFVVTLFLLGGMVEVVYEIALRQRMVGPRMLLDRIFRFSGVLAFSLILLVYVMLRVTNLTH